MITLSTGLPGAGKSLYTITYVKQYAEKEGRPVYYHGIKDLSLPWLPMENGADWTECPSGSIIVIDECQTTFRPRSNGSTVPKHVAELETHRHKGYDIFLITQHPQLLDANVRKLIGRHFNVIRAFGFGKAMIHEFQECKDQPAKSKADSIKHLFSYPKESYTYYKSAEIHTVKSRLPAKVYFLIAVPIILMAIAYAVFSYLPGHKKDKSIQGIDKSNLVQVSQSKPAEKTYLENRTPEIQNFAFTAPVYKEIIKPVRAPYPAACVQSKRTGCNCYTSQATKLQIDEAVCQQIVKTGIFIDWEMDAQNATTAQKAQTQQGDGDAVPHIDSDFTHAVGMTSRVSPSNPPAT